MGGMTRDRASIAIEAMTKTGKKNSVCWKRNGAGLRLESRDLCMVSRLLLLDLDRSVQG